MAGTQPQEAPAYPAGAERAARATNEHLAPPVKPAPNKEMTKIWKEAKDEIEKFIRDPKETTLLLVAGTGTGKTLAGTQIALDALPPESKMVMTENLRYATQKSAEDVAASRGQEVGGEVGYQHKYERRIAKDNSTRLLFCPIQSLLNKIEDGNHLLEQYDLVMVDEVHKESKQNEMMLVALRDIQQKRIDQGKKPLKVILTSATMDVPKLKDYFNARVKEVKGENIEITPDFHDKKVSMPDLPKAAAEKVKFSIDQGDKGDILVFLSGQKQIEEAQKELATHFEGDAYKDIVVLPYMGSMSKDEQERTRNQLGGKRVVILATNAAQESLTWPTIKVVVDTCTHKHQMFDPITGKSYLVEEPAPLDHLMQRKGRVGRVAPKPGDASDKYYPLTTKDDWEGRPKHEDAEIMRTDLTTDVLTLLASGYDPYPDRTKKNAFPYLNKPYRSHVELAMKRLQMLGAIGEDGKLTEKGQFMARLQLNVNNASLVADGVRYGVPDDAAALAAMLEEYPQAFDGDSPALNALKGGAHKSDLLPMIRLLHNYKGADNKEQWATERGLRPDLMKDAFDLYKQLLEAQQGPPPLAANEMMQYGEAGLDLALYDSFADMPIAGFSKRNLKVKGVGGESALMMDKRSAIAGTKTFEPFISANVRTITKNGVIEGRLATLNHTLGEKAKGVLNEKEHPSTPKQTPPPDDGKKEEPGTQNKESNNELQQPEEQKQEEPAPPPPKPLKWYQRVGNWFKGFFQRLFG